MTQSFRKSEFIASSSEYPTEEMEARCSLFETLNDLKIDITAQLRKIIDIFDRPDSKHKRNRALAKFS